MDTRNPSTETHYSALTVQTNGSNNISTRQRGIRGWYLRIKAPVLIVFCLVAGAVTAIGNLLLFTWLDGKTPEKSIPQNWAQIIAVVFANVTRALLGASLGLSYIQHVWRRYRTRFMRLQLVDQLYSLASSPADLLNLSIIWNAKFEWLFAFLCIVVPAVATAFPPGSLKIVRLEVAQVGNLPEVSVPIMNLTYRRDESYAATELGALFKPDGDLNIHYVKPIVQEEVTKILRNGELTLWETPEGMSGRNSSYQVEYTGPQLRCKEVTPPNSTTLVKMFNPLVNTTSPDFDASRLLETYQFFLTANYLNYDPYDDREEGASSFTIYYRPEVKVSPDEVRYEESVRTQSDFKATRCFIGTVDYIVKVVHSVGRDLSNITYTVKEDTFKPVTNASYDSRASLRNYFFKKDADEEVTYDFSTGRVELLQVAYDRIDPAGTIPFWERFRAVQCLALLEAFVSSIAGQIQSFGEIATLNLKGSNILGTKLAKVTNDVGFDGLEFFLTPSMVEQAFENITVSLPAANFEGWTTKAPLKIRDWSNIYEFNRPLLLIPYGIVILTTLLLSLVGLWGLYRNEWVSAKGNSFLQVATTISAPGAVVLREEASKCCKGGEENYSEELLRVKVKFGELEQGPGSQESLAYNSSLVGEVSEAGTSTGNGYLGFGTPEEVVPKRRKA